MSVVIVPRIAGEGVTTLDGMGGDVTLVAGTNVTIVDGSQTITISASPGAGGIASINSDATSAQAITTGTAGTDFAIANPGSGSHVLNLPTASASARGALNSANWSTFNGKQTPGATVLLPDGSLSTPGMAFTNETNTGWSRAGTKDLMLSVGGTQVLEFLATTDLLGNTNVNMGYGPPGAISTSPGTPVVFYSPFSGNQNYVYTNSSTAATSVTTFLIGSGPGTNFTQIENWANNTVNTYLGSGSAFFSSPFQSQLVIGAETTTGFLGFTVGGRTLAKEKMRLTQTLLQLSNGTKLDVNSTQIINVTDPTTAQMAATKNYADNRVGVFPSGFFGAASDGDVVLDGVNTFAWASLSGSTYTALRPVYFHNLTINSGKTLALHAFSVNCTGILANAGTISCNGGAGGNAPATTQGTGGTLGIAGGTLPIVSDIGIVEFGIGRQGTTGANGTTGAGTDGSPATSGAPAEGTTGGNSGNGGSGVSGAGGAGQTFPGGPAVTWKKIETLLPYGGNWAGASGASGSGDGVNNGGGGGGGGASGGIIGIFASTVNNTGTIAANGGAGGNGETPATFTIGIGGGGGGGGGSGGVIYMLANVFTSLGTMITSGGAAGAAGSGRGTGTNGTAGTAGSSGLILRYQGSTDTWI